MRGCMRTCMYACMHAPYLDYKGARIEAERTVRDLPGVQLPHTHSKRIYVRLLVIGFALDHLGGHPQRGPALCHCACMCVVYMHACICVRVQVSMYTRAMPIHTCTRVCRCVQPHGNTYLPPPPESESCQSPPPCLSSCCQSGYSGSSGPDAGWVVYVHAGMSFLGPRRWQSAG